MTLTLFDLDNTLLAGDSDYEWGRFLVNKKLVDADYYEEANLRFYEDYKRGTLDIFQYSAFAFEPLTRFSMLELQKLHQEFMTTVIRPMITDKARALVRRHQQRDEKTIVITATNSFITRPIAIEFNISELIATEPLIKNNRYTTEVDGTPCFQEGKVIRFKQWLQKNNWSLSNSYFYSDSHNDVPLLEMVTHPVAVDPDEQLKSIAKDRNWEIISLRDND